MKLVNLIPLKEIDFRNQDAFDAYQKQHQLRPDTKVTIAGKVTTAGQASQKSAPSKGASVFDKNKGGSVFGKSSGASDGNDVEALTSYKDFDKFFKANKNKLDKNYVDDIEGQIGALDYLESDYEAGDADREEVLIAYEELQDLIKKAMSKGNKSTSKSKPFDADTDTKDFANALPKGFSEYSGGTIDGVTSFGDDNGNNIFVSDPSVYDDKGNYAVSGYNDDDMSDANYKSFKDKQQAIEYAKQLATKLSGSTKSASKDDPWAARYAADKYWYLEGKKKN